MRFLLDTNVISELRKGPRADPGVAAWFADVDGDELALSTIVMAELRLGILRLRRRDPVAAEHLDDWLADVDRTYRDRILSLGDDVLERWARLNVERPLPVIDSLLAATCVVHDLTFVTRNTNDLTGVAVRLHNPFSLGDHQSVSE